MKALIMCTIVATQATLAVNDCKPAPPEVAARVLTRPLPSNLSGYRVPPREGPPAPVVVVQRPPAPSLANPPMGSCCTSYTIPLPETRVRIVK